MLDPTYIQWKSQQAFGGEESNDVVDEEGGGFEGDREELLGSGIDEETVSDINKASEELIRGVNAVS